jgi:hypothetical protein
MKRPEDAIGARQLLVGTRDSIGHVMDPGGAEGSMDPRGPSGSTHRITI